MSAEQLTLGGNPGRRVLRLYNLYRVIIGLALALLISSKLDSELLELAEMENDEDTAHAVVADVERYAAHVDKLEFQRMFSGKMDASNAFVAAWLPGSSFTR